MSKQSTNNLKAVNVTKGKRLEKSVAPSYEGREGLVYARVSSKRQEMEGSGLQSQETRCMNDLQAIGVPYKKSFLDSYTGGGDFMERPAMQDLLAYIDANPHKRFLVVFDDLKRFARDVQFHLKLRQVFRGLDVELRCLNYRFDETDEGQFIETILAAGAELERKQNRRQVIQKMKARLEAGYWPFGSKKGYTLEKDRLHGKIAIPNKEGLEILRPALEAFASGNIVRKMDLCDHLIEKGFWRKQKVGRYVSKLTEILKDPFYCGDIEYLSWEVNRRSGQHKGIIARETFDLIQKRIRREDSGVRVRLDISPDFPLRGLLSCSSCKKHLTAAWSKGRKAKYAYYFCQDRSCPLYRKSAKKVDVEKGFDDILQRSRLHPQVEKVISAVFDQVWKQEIGNLEHHQSTAEQKIKTLKENVRELTGLAAKTKNEQVRGAYEDQIEEIAGELKEIKESSLQGIDFTIPYRTALNKAVGLLRNPRVTWKKSGVEEKHQLFYFIFDQKLEYSAVSGYRTAEIPRAARVFEEFVESNSDDVETGGIEPPCRNFSAEPSTSVC